MKEAYIQRIIAHHTMPRDAGRMFAHTRPKLAAYTHIVRIGNERFAPPTVEDIVAETRKTYDGRLTVGARALGLQTSASTG